MYDLQLSGPVLLNKQLKTIAAELSLPLHTIFQIAGEESPYLAVITEDTVDYKKGEPVNLLIYETAEDGEEYGSLNPILEGISYKYGFDAINWYCQEKDVECNLISRITLPAELFHECTIQQWYDISNFFEQICISNQFLKNFMGSDNPPVIVSFSNRLRESIERLETGKIGGKIRKWAQGRMMRGLNDLGYSLLGGWSQNIKDEFEFFCNRDEEEVNQLREEARIQRHEYEAKQKLIEYYRYCRSKGVDEDIALERASNYVMGNPSFRTHSVEGIGIYFSDFIYTATLASFLEKHRHTFIKSDLEKEIYDKVRSGDDLIRIFQNVGYKLDDNSECEDHWAVAVANVIIRETGINLYVFLASEDNQKYKNRNCIIFPDRAPWEYNDKERRLSEGGIKQILDRYAIELNLDVSPCYFLMDFFDDTVTPHYTTL